MRGLFVTGTDTNVGKTFVGVALARRARTLGWRVFAFKPIESGCTRDLGDDQATLTEAAGGWQSANLRGIYQLRKAMAPAAAADLERKVLDLDLVVRTFHEGAAQADLSVVEGVGGWRVPLTKNHDVGWLARRLALPIVIVARSGLGTLNHSLLTIEAIERDQGRIAALVLSHRPDDDLDLALNNVDQLRQRWSGEITLYDGNPSTLDSVIERST